jgi:hypothetical protein
MSDQRYQNVVNFQGFVLFTQKAAYFDHSESLKKFTTN